MNASMRTSIQFINHASVIVSDGETSLLSDPWYTGDAFFKGWNLLSETTDRDVNQILKSVTHIWISHEHPDHFSVSFFKSFSQIIKDLSITLLFQKTRDKRVFKFLTAQGFKVHELDFNRALSISNDFKVTCIKDGFYDSGLLIESHGEKILNLNDCEITTPNRADEVHSLTGNVDVLLTQFSFAAWKGGEKNKRWRDEAAAEKIQTINLQIEKFSPNIVIPFASFMYFSNQKNFYLNDAANRPEDLTKKLKKHASKLRIMLPLDSIGGPKQKFDNDNAIAFWKAKFQDIKPIHQYDSAQLNELEASFTSYCHRISKNNNMSFVRLIRLVSPMSAFQPCVFLLEDLNVKIKFDYVNRSFAQTNEEAMLSMNSQCAKFIFDNPFGFDALTVNGCFSEVGRNGFLRATRTLAIENLNNIGVRFELQILYNLYPIKLFLKRLYRVARKLDA
jgi:hypothetical protein